MRTKEEIEAEIKKGEKFIKEHPHSMFGDDNVAHFKRFKELVEMALNGKTVDEIENFVDNAHEDEHDMFSYDVVEWLRGDVNEDFW